MIWHRKVPPSGLWLCGSASTWQWRTPPSTQRHRALCRTHVPTTTFHTGAVCSRRRRTDPSSAGSASTCTCCSTSGHVAWLRGYVGFTMLASLPLLSIPHALLPCWSRGDLSVSGLCKLGSLNASFLHASGRDSASVYKGAR